MGLRSDVPTERGLCLPKNILDRGLNQAAMTKPAPY